MILFIRMVDKNEPEVGQAMKEVFDSGLVARQDVFITSKLWNTDHRRVHSACLQTLEDLRLKYLDLYLVHSPISMKQECWETGEYFDKEGKLCVDSGVKMQDVWAEMEKLVDEGLVKHIGLSNFNVKRISEVLKTCRIKPAALQVELHPYLPQNELVEFCKKQGIVVTAYSPLGSGRDPNLMQDPLIQDISKRLNKSPAQILIKWAIQRGTSVIPKSVTPSRIKENAEMDFEISEEDMKRIAGIGKSHRFISPATFWKYKLFEDERE